MYEENENRLNWGSILKKLVFVILAILIILGVISMITRCTNKNDEPEEPVNTVVDLTKQLDQLEAATLAYLTKDNVPIELNASKTIRLKILINRNLLTGIKDSEGNTCDANESYSEITRLADNYAVKMSLTCGTNKDYRVIYVGCFEECNGDICKGTEASTGGLCTITQNESNNNSNNENQNTDTKDDSKVNSSNNNNNNNNNNSNSNNSKPSTGSNTSSSSGNSNTSSSSSSNTTKKETLYEYKQCTTTSVRCTSGTLNNGMCETYYPQTVEGLVVRSGGETKTTTTKVAATKVPSTSYKSETVYLNNTSQAVNTSTVSYTFVKYVAGKGYQYTKSTKVTTYTSKCNSGTPDGNGYCIITSTTTTPYTYSCADKTYTYNASTNKCTKSVLLPTYSNPITTPGTCQYTWSYSTSLPGWTRTGNTR